MIRRNGQKGYLLVTQNDHAVLAGQIAAHWGGAHFPVPDPREAVVTAIECHDAGWSMHDDKPTLNHAHVPASFYEMPLSSYVRVWVASVSAAAARGGPMAGLIVSWHFTALSRIVPSNGENEAVQNMLHDFSAHQRARQIDYCGALSLSKTLAEYPPNPVHQRDQDALYNLWVLRMCDWISLTLCADALPAELQSPPVMPVGQRDLSIKAKWRDRKTLCLEPWPLDVPELAVTISGKRVPAGEYRRESDLLRVYEQAKGESLSFILAASVV